MKTLAGPSKIRLLSLMLLSVLIAFCCYVYHNYYTYNSIKVVVKDNATIEYGSGNYDINNLVKEVEGDIVSVKDEINTSIVGDQEIIVEVKKDNIIREVPIIISVVDTKAPIIQLKEEKVVITQGDTYDLTSNVESVNDEVDGGISYLNEVHDDSTLYYNFTYNFDEIDNVGDHEIIVNAKDKYGNVSTMSFTLEVVEPPVVSASVQKETVYSNLPANAAGGDLVSMAYSLVGAPYVAGANGPYGFDCSGFVQYLYSRVGIGISRSTSTQINDGVAVSYENAQPGDILLWGYTEGAPTHSALYVGNGQMVHATNPRQGVLASDVAAWTRGSGTHVIAVRRIG